MPIAIQFMLFYWVNLVLDYPLQCEFQKKYKCEYHSVMLVHCMIWGFGLSGALYYFGLFAWWKVVFLVIGHAVMDTWKAREWYKSVAVRPIGGGAFKLFRSGGLSDTAAYFIDQTFHLIQLLIVFFA